MYKLTNATGIIRLSDSASIPADPNNSDYAQYLLWLLDGNTPEPVDTPPAPTPDDLKASLINAVQAHLDAGAQALGYDDIKTAATYAGEAAVPRFQNEGRALRSWRSYCWDHCRVVMDAVTAGERAIPTETELLQELPVLVLEAVPA